MKKTVLALSVGLALGCTRGPWTNQETAGGIPAQPPAATQPAVAPALPAAAPAPKPVPAPMTAEAEQPAELQPYVPSSTPLVGTLASIGSDSMEPLMLLWKDDFLSHHPGLKYEFICKGSATAPPALMAGKVVMGQMSREMNQAELDKFLATFGYPPTRFVVAADALAVYVNQNNPVTHLTLAQVDAIFSTTCKAGHAPINTWGDLGFMDDAWRSRPIQTYGRNPLSGTRAFFLEHVLKNGEFKPNLKVFADQFQVVEAAAIDASGICYGPIQHRVQMVKPVPLAYVEGATPIAASVANVMNGRYPLTRFLNIYVNRKPGTPMDPTVKEFLRFILSRDGQTDVESFGAVALPPDIVAANRALLR